MEHSDYIINLKYYMGLKCDSLIDYAYDGVLSDMQMHNYILANNLFKFILGYVPDTDYEEEIKEMYTKASLQLNNYLETNLYYDY